MKRIPAFATLLLFLKLFSATVFAQQPIVKDIVLRASFESDTAEPGMTAHSKITLSDECPAPIIYDPVLRKSVRNSHSLSCSGQAEPGLTVAADRLKISGSFTLECFVSPTNAAESFIAGKMRRSDQAAEWRLALDPFWAHNQWYLRGLFTSPRRTTEKIEAGYYGSSAQWKGPQDEDRWRHLALVWNSEEKAATFFIDHYLSRTVPAENLDRLDDSPFVIGGPKFSGLIDEVRLTRRALQPAYFLRARDSELTDASFVSDQQILPRDSGALDIKEHFGAVGDGITDDTAAFQSAFRQLPSRVPLAYHTLLIPRGRYLISKTLHCSRFIDVKGAGPDKTFILLKDGIFKDPGDPQPVLRMSSSVGAPGSYDGVNGSSISIYLDCVTIDTGKNNPGAKALEYHSNNIGRLENVVLRSGDGSGVVGLDLTHHDVGPALVKNVTITGFDYGVAIHYQEYSMTFEHLRLKQQRIAGILNQGNIIAVRGLVSENEVPAIVSEAANSMVTLIDSSLTGGSLDHAAIRADGGLYAARVHTAGYRDAIFKRVLLNQETTIAGPDIDEFIDDRIVRGFGDPDGALKLPIEETPEPPLPPVSEWVSILTFADQVKEGDWSPALQQAIDSGARLVYLPTTQHYQFGSPVHLRGPVERLMGFGSELHWMESAWKQTKSRQQTDETTAPPPLLIFDDLTQNVGTGSAEKISLGTAGRIQDRVVVLDRLNVQSLQHASKDTLVLKSSSCDRYTTAAAGGRLFIEDAGGADWHFDHPQQIWVRQWNPESHADGPCIQNMGGTMWVLGFKTEYESSKLLASQGARTEILGGFIYPIGEIPANRPVFTNVDSDMALVYGLSVYHSNHKVQILDVRSESGVGAVTKSFENDSLIWAGSRARMDLFTTRGRRQQ